MTDSIVLGLGGNLDYLVTWDAQVIENLVTAYDLRAAELTTAVPINSERDLLRCLLAFLRDGTGGERFVATTTIIETFAAQFQKAIALGGTAARAAIALDRLGVKTTLHLVSIDDHVRRLLPRSCSYICSASHDSTHPHLIMQFRAGTEVRVNDIDVRAPHPNRVIFTNDPPHQQMQLSEELGTVLADARVFLISGFNVVQDPVILDQRLAILRRHLARVPADCLVQYEDAGFHLPELRYQINRQLEDLIDVHSMNEDELQTYLGRTCNLLDPEEMARALTEIRTIVHAPTVMIHTQYWSLAVGRNPDSFAQALQGGVTLASTRYFHGDNFSETDYDRIAHASPTAAGADFATAIEKLLPGLVRCVPAIQLATSNPTTIGLGDSFVGGFLGAWTRS